MGLDSFWKMPDGVSHPTFDPPINLCGGMLSNNGEGSFRGKVYDGLIAEVSGITLYQEEIPNKYIHEISNCLNFRPWDKSLPIGQEEYEDLKRMFFAYANAGASLVGWW